MTPKQPAWLALCLWILLLCAASAASAQSLTVWPSPRRAAPDSDGAVTFDLVVVNTSPEQAREVVLRDALPPGTDLLWADPPARVVDDRLEWALGQLDPGGSARVKVRLRGGADLGAQVTAAIGGSPRAFTAQPILPGPLSPEEASALAPTPDADAADPEILAVVAQHHGDPDALIALVRDHIGYEPYTGSLRGARGTLWSAAGNSLDRASLLIALLRAAGRPARYADQALGDADAQALLQTLNAPRDLLEAPLDRAQAALLSPEAMTPYMGDALADMIANDPDLRARIPQELRPDLLAIARQHTLVQHLHDNAWDTLDPWRGAPQGPHDAPYDEIAPERRHILTVSLMGELYNPLFGPTSQRQTPHLSAQLSTVALVGRPLELRYLASGESLPGLIFSAITYTYTPQLWLDGQLIAQGTALQELFTNFPGGSELLTAVSLDLTTRAPDAPPQTWRHAILDRLGASVRNPGADGAQANLEALDGSPALGALDVTLLHISTSRTPLPRVLAELERLQRLQTQTEALTAEAEALLTRERDQRLTPAEADRLRALLAPFGDAAASMGRLVGLNYFQQSDELSQRMARLSLVRAWPDRARVLFTTMKSSAVGARPRMDIKYDRLRVVGDPEVGALGERHFRTLRGMIISALEGRVVEPLVLEGGALISVETVFNAAQAQGISLRAITWNETYDLYRMDLPDDARSLMLQALEEGRFLMVPDRPIEQVGKRHLVWLEYDLATGDVLSRGVNGDGPTTVEYNASMDASPGPVAGAVIGAIPGFCFGVAAGGVSLINKFVTGNVPDPYGGADLAGCGLAAIPGVGIPLAFSANSGAQIVQGKDPVGDSIKFLFALALEYAAANGAELFLPPRPTNLSRFIAGLKVGMCIGFMVAYDAYALLAQAIDPPLPGWGAGDPGPSGLQRFPSLASRPDAPLDLTAPPATLAQPWTASGDLAAAWDQPAWLPAGALTAQGQLWRDNTLLGDQAWTLSATATRADQGQLTGQASFTGAQGLLTAHLHQGAATLTDEVTFWGDPLDEGQDSRFTLRAAQITWQGHGGALWEGGAQLDLHRAQLTTGALGWGDVSGALDAQPDAATLDADADRALALRGLPAQVNLTRGDRLSLSPRAAASLDEPLRLWAELPDGWTARFQGGDLEATPPPGAPAGAYTVYLWARPVSRHDLVVGAAVTVQLQPGQGASLTLTHDPLLTTRKGGAGDGQLQLPLVFRGELVQRGEQPQTWALTAGATGGLTAQPATPQVTLQPGERRVVYVSATHQDSLPAPGTSVRITLHATADQEEVEAEATLAFPALSGAQGEVSPEALFLPPGGEGTVTIRLTPYGNAPGRLTLTQRPLEHLRLDGLPDEIDVVPGEPVVLTATARLGQGAAPGLGYMGQVTLWRGEVREAILLAQVYAVGPDANQALCAAQVANELGDAPLESALLTVAGAIEQAAFRCLDLDIYALKGALENLVAELDDPALAAPREALRGYADQLLEPVGCATLELAALADLLDDLKALLEAKRDHDFRLTLSPPGVITRPGGEVTLALDIDRLGALPAELDLTVEGLEGVIASPQALDGPLRGLPVTLQVPQAGRWPVTVRARVRGAAAFQREARALIIAQERHVEIAHIGADPPFAIPGSKLNLFAQLFNVVNAPQDLEATITLTRPDGTTLYESPAPTPIHLTTRPGLQRFELGRVDTFGAAEGAYTAQLTLRLPDDPEPAPGGVGEGVILIGQPFDAQVEVSPALLPPGDVQATAALSLQRRPWNLLPGLGNLTQIQLLSAEADGPNGLWVMPDGTIYYSTFGTRRSSDLPGYQAGTSLNRLTPEGLVQFVATVPSSPTGLALGPDGAMYVANVGNPERITRVDLQTGAAAPWWDLQASPPTNGWGENVIAIVFDALGNLYATELIEPGLFVTYPGDRVYRLGADLNNDQRADSATTFITGFERANHMILDPRTQDLLVCDSDRRRVVRVNTLGAPQFIPWTSDAFDAIQGLWINDLGQVFVLDDASGDLWVYPTEIIDDHTEISGPRVWIAGGLYSRYNLFGHPDGHLITADPDDDFLLQLFFEPQAPAPAVTLSLLHQTAPSRLPQTASPLPTDLTDPASVTWAELLTSDTQARRYAIDHDLTGLRPGDVVQLSAGTQLQLSQPGHEPVTADLPPARALVDHIVGISPDTRSLRREDTATFTLTLRNHRDQEDTYSLRVKNLAPALLATLPAQVAVPALGEATVTLQLVAQREADLGTSRLQIEVDSALGGHDEVTAHLDVNDLSILASIEPAFQTVYRGQEVCWTFRYTKENPALDDRRLGSQFATVGLAGVTANRREIGGLVEFFRETRNEWARTTCTTLTSPAGTFPFTTRLVPLGRQDSIAEARASVRVIDNHQLRLEADPVTWDYDRSTTERVFVTLYNDGDSPLEVRLSHCCGVLIGAQYDVGPHALAPGRSLRLPVNLSLNDIVGNPASLRFDARDTRDSQITASITVPIQVRRFASLSFQDGANKTADAQGVASWRLLLRRSWPHNEPCCGDVQLHVDGAPTLNAQIDPALVDMNTTQQRNITVTLRQLEGLAPGPWPIRFSVTPQGAQSPQTEIFGTLTIPPGGLTPRFDLDTLTLPADQPGDAWLTLLNRDHLATRSGALTLSSDPPGVTFDLADAAPSLPPGAQDARPISVAGATPGQFQITAQVTDDADLITRSDSFLLQILDPANAPQITGLLLAPDPPLEGAPFLLTVQAADPNGDALTYDFDLDNDGAFEITGAADPTQALARPDDGPVTIRVAATDPEGGRAVAPFTIQVQNVPPRFTSSPPELATEGQPYRYAPALTDPGADAIALTLDGPEGAALIDGELRWTPSRAQALEGRATLRLLAADDDGGLAEQLWEVTITALPEPNRAPLAPTITAPEDQALLQAQPVQVAWDAALDPDGDALRYTLHLATTDDFAQPAVELTDLTQDDEGALTAELPPLARDQPWFVRVRAHDAALDGPWSETVTFTLQNQAPGTPRLLEPVDGQEVPPGSVSLRLEGTTDPDGDALRYLVEVFDAPDPAGAPSAQAWLTLPEGDLNGEATFEAPAEARAWYWRATAEDALGLRGQPTNLEEFTVLIQSQNTAPPSPRLLSPTGGELLAPGTVELVFEGVEDPDGDALTYTVWAQDPQGQEALRELSLPHAQTLRVQLEATAPGRWRWSALATDARGLDSPEAAPESFLIDQPEADLGTPDADDLDLPDLDDDLDADDLDQPDLVTPDLPEPDQADLDQAEPVEDLDQADLDQADLDQAEPVEDLADLPAPGDNGGGLEEAPREAVTGDVQGGAGCGCATPSRPAPARLPAWALVVMLGWMIVKRRRDRAP